MKYSNLEIFQNRNNLQILVNDKNELFVTNCEKEMDAKQLYSLFLMQAYESCLSYIEYLTEHPEETNKIIPDLDAFLDMYSISKEEFHRVRREIEDELRN